MPAITYRMPAGIPGDITRQAQARVEPVLVAENIVYGSAVQLDEEGLLVGPTDDDAPMHGFLARPYPSQASVDGFGGVEAGRIGDVLRSGYISVKLSAAETGTPVKGTPVKVVFVATGSYVAGDIAMSEGVAVDGCMFMGAPDASGNIEIAFNI